MTFTKVNISLNGDFKEFKADCLNIINCIPGFSDWKSIAIVNQADWNSSRQSSSSIANTLRSSARYVPSPHSLTSYEDEDGEMKVSPGISMSNRIFVIQREDQRSEDDLVILLRVYGEATSLMINRTLEAQLCELISSRGVDTELIAPRVLATFNNGRMEQFLTKAVTLSSAQEMKIYIPELSRILARLHHLIAGSGVKTTNPEGDMFISVDSMEIEVESLWSRLTRWIDLLADKLTQLSDSDINSTRLLEAFGRNDPLSLKKYLLDQVTKAKANFLSIKERVAGSSPIVDAFLQIVLIHGDLQYGNILKVSGDQRLVLVDFEYSGLAEAAFDIGNHFFEQCCHYQSDAFILEYPSQIPNSTERWLFYHNYLKNSNLKEDAFPMDHAIVQSAFTQIDEIVLKGAIPVSHLFWSIWGCIMSLEPTSPNFPYLQYARERFEMYNKP